MDIKIAKNQFWREVLKDTEGNPVQVITSDEHMDKWYLYNVATDGRLIKIATGSNPMFEQRIDRTK